MLTNIAKIRKAKGLSQTELADRLGIHVTNMNRLERGRSVPDIARLQQIARALEVSVADLLPEIPLSGIRGVSLNDYTQDGNWAGTWGWQDNDRDTVAIPADEAAAKPLPVPPFDIPLSDEELVLMGKIAVMWGQIDEAFNSTLRWVMKINPVVFESLLGNQMIGTRVNHLRATLSTVQDAKSREMLGRLIEAMNNVLPDRNAAMHGCWGRFVLDPSYKKFRIGTYNHQKPKTRFYTSDLRRLYRSLTEVLTLLAELLLRSVEHDPEPTQFNRNKIFFAPQPPDERAAGVWFERGDKVVPVGS